MNNPTHNVAGLAAKDAERRKVLKLGLRVDHPSLQRDGPMAYKGSKRVRFVGCGIETGGIWSVGLQGYFKTIVALGIKNHTLTKRTASGFSRFWRTRISVTLQRSLARCAIEKVNNIREHRRKQHVGPAAGAGFDLAAPVAAVAGPDAQGVMVGATV